MWATSSASFFHSPLNLVTVIRTTRCVLISSHIEHEHRAPYISTLSPLNNRDFIALTVQWPFLHSPYRLKKLNYAADCCRRSLTNLYIRLKAARCHMIDMRAQQQQSISSRLNFTSTQKKKFKRRTLFSALRCWVKKKLRNSPQYYTPDVIFSSFISSALLIHRFLLLRAAPLRAHMTRVLPFNVN